MNLKFSLIILILFFLGSPEPLMAASTAYEGKIFNPGQLKPIDSVLKVKTGDKAPDFELAAVSGRKVRLSDYAGEKNVMLTFIPAAWTPVCSDQWPGYNIARPLFEKYDTVPVGISVDNIPTLFAWTSEMGELWFEVLSDFYPHGEVSSSYGVLRSDGTSERAIVIIDKMGVIRFVHVGDINVRPDLKTIMDELSRLE